MRISNHVLLRLGMGVVLLGMTASAGAGLARPAPDLEQLIEQGRWTEAERLVGRDSTGTAGQCSWSGYDRALLAHVRASYFEAAPAGDDAPARLAADCAATKNQELQGAVLLLHGRAVYDRTPDDGDFTEADTVLKRAWSLNSVHGRTDMQAENLFYLGLVQQFRRNWVDANALFERSLRLAEQADDKLAQALAHRHLGFVAGQTGDAAGARAGAERSLALRLASGAKLYMATGYLGVGRTRQDAGDTAGAKEAYLKAVEVATSGQNRRILHGAQMALAQLLKTSAPGEGKLWAERALETAQRFRSDGMAEQARRYLDELRG